MGLPNQITCRSCCRPMETGVTIAPVCGRPRLLAFVCSGCSGTKSELIYPQHWLGGQATKSARRQSKEPQANTPAYSM
jgi:hypothetical protein